MPPLAEPPSPPTREPLVIQQRDALLTTTPPRYLPPHPKRSRCLIIYTGGTIGMKRGADGSLSPASGYLLSALRAMPELQHDDCPLFHLLEWDTPMDSSDFSPLQWTTLARQIEAHYYDFDGFCVLHGTDTLAYTASALSFMLEHLNKTVILTGSMIPLAAPVSDAKRNVIISLLSAVNLDIPEVCVFFNNLLLRGNRAKKLDPFSVNAFDSPNYPPLATMGTSIIVNRTLIRPAPRRRFSVCTQMYEGIGCVIMTPAFDPALISLYVGRSTPDHPVALVLQLFGGGNGPVHRPEFVRVMREAAACSAVVVVTTQCLRGSVDMAEYATGTGLGGWGIIDGRDMTVEACVCKLSYLMGRGLRGAQLKAAMEGDLRGELTLKHTQAYNTNEHSLDAYIDTMLASSGVQGVGSGAGEQRGGRGAGAEMMWMGSAAGAGSGEGPSRGGLQSGPGAIPAPPLSRL